MVKVGMLLSGLAVLAARYSYSLPVRTNVSRQQMSPMGLQLADSNRQANNCFEGRPRDPRQHH